MTLKTILQPLLFTIGLNVVTFAQADENTMQIFDGSYSNVINTFTRAKFGDADAQYKIAVMYNTGKIVSKDNQEALKWYRKAAEQGNAYAQNNLAVMYDKGVENVLEDDIEALKWYLIAA